MGSLQQRQFARFHPQELDENSDIPATVFFVQFPTDSWSSRIDIHIWQVNSYSSYQIITVLNLNQNRIVPKLFLNVRTVLELAQYWVEYMERLVI
jgi:hypothetical protein